MTEKKKTDKWFSLYIRFRDALEFHRETGADISFGRCCTCGGIHQWRYMDCGHFVSKGMGGSSGVRWDERNANLQCKGCNAFKQGAPDEYGEFMLKKFGLTGHAVIAELKLKHKIHRYTKQEIIGLGLHYKAEYEKLIEQVKGAK